MAAPAAAGGGVGYAPVPDALALLMLDQGATFSTAAARPVLDLPELRGFDVRGGIMPDPSPTRMAAFEEMRVAPQVDAPIRVGMAGSRFDFSAAAQGFAGWRLTRFEDSTVNNGAGYAVRDIMASSSVRLRPPTALDGRVVIRIDGKQESPVLSIGGGIPAALWNAIPKD